MELSAAALELSAALEVWEEGDPRAVLFNRELIPPNLNVLGPLTVLDLLVGEKAAIGHHPVELRHDLLPVLRDSVEFDDARFEGADDRQLPLFHCC
jgi:hypothetical protein